ncbi:MAG: hypothetical protein D6808_04400 [Candidatus Dadabacteria bacterium]|nr:MAG: hypothetical protein D6808_04400 [Candidatus Dadabacteria bacterium]
MFGFFQVGVFFLGCRLFISPKGYSYLSPMVLLSLFTVYMYTSVPAYKEKFKIVYDLVALVQLRFVAIAEEAYYIDHEQYGSCSNEECLMLPGIGRLSKGVKLNIISYGQRYVAKATHVKGTGQVYKWDSALGGLVP